MDEIRLKDMQILEFGTIILPQVVKNKKKIIKKNYCLAYGYMQSKFDAQIATWMGLRRSQLKISLMVVMVKHYQCQKWWRFFSSFSRLRSWICIVIRNISKININFSISHRLIFLWIKFKFDYEINAMKISKKNPNTSDYM